MVFLKTIFLIYFFETIRVQPSAKSETSRTNIYIEGLPDDWNEDVLKMMYEQFGEIAETKILTDHATQRRTGRLFLD